jgi:hypothetical protein
MGIRGFDKIRRTRTTASRISCMLPGSLAERYDAHQRPGLDEQRGVVGELGSALEGPEKGTVSSQTVM